MLKSHTTYLLEASLLHEILSKTSEKVLRVAKSRCSYLPNSYSSIDSLQVKNSVLAPRETFMCDICVVQHIEVCANLSLEFIFAGMALIPAQSLKKRRENAKAGDTQTRRTFRTKPSFIQSWSISHI